jgi:UDP-N-acetyl-D-mannosaminuronic acid dehydrogenase
MAIKKACVVGCGYIGLPTATVFADAGLDVLAVDINEKIVNGINEGHPFFDEPGLTEMLQKAVRNGKLRAATAPDKADVFIIAVPTPFQDDEIKSCDLTSVLLATESVIPFIKKGNVLIVESTIAPRSIEDYVVPLLESKGLKPGRDVFVAHCPERVLPGNILHEIVNNNRIVGGFTPACAEAAAEVYRLIVKGEISITEAKTAEMSKCMENVFRDVNIALANELAVICNELEINCLDVIELANKHPRVNILAPGPGVGGHCLAIDPYFVSAKTPDKANIIRLGRAINESMPAFVVARAKKLLLDQGVSISHSKIAVLGVAYKSNVNDCRESPALDVISELQKAGAEVAIHDPHVEQYNQPIGEVLEDACIALVLTGHNEYRGKALASHVSAMRIPLIFDARNVVAPMKGTRVVNYGNLFG